MKELTIHLIANSHLDPVWLWDWREGLNEGITTCRTMLDLMDESPDLTYNRGEAVIYEHIERTDPETFRRIRAYVRAGRWDAIGGTYLQSDHNLPATETLSRNLLRGQRYFASRFGRRVEAGWAADCFGHSAGLPEILASAGIRYFAFTRPSQGQVPMREPAFWWVGPGGSRVLAYRPMWQGYLSERHKMAEKLDHALAMGREGKLRNLACFYGLGNHGGGATRRHLADIRAWSAAHPEVRVLHSTLHRFFHALEREAAARKPRGLPVFRGEMNFVLRGCYSSAARLKFQFRRAEAAIGRAERTDAVIAAALPRRPADTAPAWDAVLFNTFHDILPGTSIERAINEQGDWLGHAIHTARRTECEALNALAAPVDTRVAPVPGADRPSGVATLAWNPHPWRFDGFVELEACLDYRPIKDYEGRPHLLPVRMLDHAGQPLPFQLVATEHNSFPTLAWRKRAVLPLRVPPMGWTVLETAWTEDTAPPAAPSEAAPATSPRKGTIGNGIFTVSAVRGATGIAIRRHGRPFLPGAGLAAAVFEDPWGSWGDEAEKDGTDVSTERERWRVTHSAVLERGPWRAALWVRLAGRRSRIDLTLHLHAGRETIEVAARTLWNERAARLKLLFPGGNGAEFEVPGAIVRRGPGMGEVPGGRWARVDGPRQAFGFASDALYNFNCCRGEFQATVARASRYADTNTLPAGAEPWRPATDNGELTFRFLLTSDLAALPRLAAELESPPALLPVWPSTGPWPREGSLLRMEPSSVRLLAFKPAEDGHGWIVRGQEDAGRIARVRLTLCGAAIELGELGARRIGSWRLRRNGAGWRAERCDATEYKIAGGYSHQGQPDTSLKAGTRAAHKA